MKHRIRRFLRCRRTKRFLMADGTWTQDLDQAAQFESIREAMVFAEKHHARAVEYVVRFDGRGDDVITPLDG